MAAYMHSGGKLWTERYKKIKIPAATFKELGAKTGYREQKQGPAHAPCTPHHQRGGQTT